MRIAILTLSLTVLLSPFLVQSSSAFPLKQIDPDRLKYVGLDHKLGNAAGDFSQSSCRAPRLFCSLSEAAKLEQLGWDSVQRQQLLTSIDHSLYYLSTPAATRAYRRYQNTAFDLSLVRRSLTRFKELLVTVKSPEVLEKKVKQEFLFYQSVGKNQRGRVEFTGYFEPTYRASRVRTAQYRYPLYRKPPGFGEWRQPHPTRTQLEGKSGLAKGNSLLKGQELVWLSDRLEAFLVQVQGSARLQLTDGSTMTVGYGGTTNYPYVSVGGELVKDGIFRKEELSLPKLLEYFAANPQDLDKYLPRNNRFIFMRETSGQPPTGSLGVPVIGDRSIATDKTLMPPGALALVVAPIPELSPSGEMDTRVVSRYVLDQDTGSAIKGAGRVDIFLGSGEVAGARAGLLNGDGSLFYLILKGN